MAVWSRSWACMNQRVGSVAHQSQFQFCEMGIQRKAARHLPGATSQLGVMLGAFKSAYDCVGQAGHGRRIARREFSGLSRDKPIRNASDGVSNRWHT